MYKKMNCYYLSSVLRIMYNIRQKNIEQTGFLVASEQEPTYQYDSEYAKMFEGACSNEVVYTTIKSIAKKFEFQYDHFTDNIYSYHRNAEKSAYDEDRMEKVEFISVIITELYNDIKMEHLILGKSYNACDLINSNGRDNDPNYMKIICSFNKELHIKLTTGGCNSYITTDNWSNKNLRDMITWAELVEKRVTSNVRFEKNINDCCA